MARSTVKQDNAARGQSLGLCEISESSQELLCTPRKAPRKIPKVPYKVLDAPDLQVYCSPLLLRDDEGPSQL